MSLLVGFDMDGVLIDSEALVDGAWILDSFMKTLRDFGIPETVDNARDLYVDNMRKNAASFCERFGIGDADELWARREENYVQDKLKALKTGRIRLFPDVASLEELSEDHAMGIVSNSPQVIVDSVVYHFSLRGIFRTWIGRGSRLSDLNLAKPAPHLLERLKSDLGLSEGYYVGDLPADVEAAKAAYLIPVRIGRNGEEADIRSLDELRRLIRTRGS